MIAVLALASLLLGQIDVPTRCRFDRSGTRFRNCSSAPFFQFATPTGAGMTAECGCTTNPTGMNNEAMTFTRASVAMCEKSDFSWVSCPVDKARVTYGDFSSTSLGIYVERAATNTVLRNRDFSNAAWTKTTMTCNKDATGIDGVALSASTCTATAAAAIVQQAATCPAATAAASIFMKRITGSGTVQVSCDGVTYTTVTPDSTWKRISGSQCSPSSRCTTIPGLIAGVCNSGGIYVKLATSGDAVALDMAQCEATNHATSPIETLGTSATRVKETPFFSLAIGTPSAVSVFSTSFSQIVAPSGPTSATTLYQSAGIYLWPFRTAANNMSCQLLGGTGATTAGGAGIVNTAEARTGCRATTTTNNTCTGGSCTATTGLAATLVSGTVQVDVGNWAANSDQTDGVVKNVCVDTSFGGCGP